MDLFRRAVVVFGSGVIAALVGSTIGIAAAGHAVNGAPMFAVFGAVIAFLATRSTTKSAMVDAARPEGEDKEDNTLRTLFVSAETILFECGVILRGLWNFKMKFFSAVGIMPLFRRWPWLFVMIAFLLLALVFPIGIVFVASGCAALSANASPAKNFIVLTR